MGVYIPIIIVQLYLWLNLLGFAFGPWRWPIHNPEILYPYIALGNIACLLGYLWQSKKRLVQSRAIGDLAVRNWVWAGVIAHVIIYLPILADRLPKGFGSVGSLVIDAGDAYKSMHEGRSASDSSLVSFIHSARTVLAPLLGLVIPIGFTRWREITVPLRIGVALSAVLQVLFWISIGTNKGLGDIVILALAAVMYNLRVGRMGLSKKLVAAIIFGLAGVAFLGYFTLNIFSRYGARNENEFLSAFGGNFDQSHYLIQIAPGPFKVFIASFFSYWTQGYYGLAQCLDLDFEWGFGVSNSWALLTWLEQYFSITQPWENSYPYRAETASGYSASMAWHSIYPWLASDFTYLGALILMFLFGALFCTTWRQATESRSAISFLLFCTLLNLFIFVPCNNQVFLGRAVFIATWSYFILWYFQKR